jgi:hypothetical protein
LVIRVVADSEFHYWDGGTKLKKGGVER